MYVLARCSARPAILATRQGPCEQAPFRIRTRVTYLHASNTTGADDSYTLILVPRTAQRTSSHSLTRTYPCRI